MKILFATILLASKLLLSDSASLSICVRCICTSDMLAMATVNIPTFDIQCQSSENYSKIDQYILPARAARLFLSEINLLTIPNKTLLQSETLEYLDLSGNYIETIPDYAFGRVPGLKYLDLSRNRLNQIPNNGFLNSYSLETLILAENDLVMLPYRFADKIPMVKTLDLSQNPLGAYFEGDGHFLHPLSYGDAPNIRTLHLDRIGLKSNAKTASFSLQGARHVENLTLRYNDMEILPNLPRYIQTLDLSQTGLRTIEARTFPYIGSLRQLIIQDALHLKKIRVHSFSSLTGLQVLKLDGCRQLEEFSDIAFGRDVQNFQLKELDLSGTSLRTLDKNLQDIIANLTKLDLTGAPWHCDCSAAWLLPHAPRELRCASPPATSGLFLSGLKPADLLCPPDWPYGNGASAVGVLLAFGSLLLGCVAVWLACEGAQLSRRIYLQKTAGPAANSPYGRVTVRPNDAEHTGDVVLRQQSR